MTGPDIRSEEKGPKNTEKAVKNPSGVPEIFREKTGIAQDAASAIGELRNEVKKNSESAFLQNIRGLQRLSSMPFSRLFYLQTLENLRGIRKPEDDLRHGKEVQVAILIPGFLCNQGVMRNLGERLSQSMNVVYPDVGMVDHAHLSLSEIADKITDYVWRLEQEWRLQKDGRYTIIGHSLGGNIALLVSQKLRVRHIVQASTPNQAPAVAKISGLQFMPALFDLRNVSATYQPIRPKEPLETLTVIIPKEDAFVETDSQGTSGIPFGFPVGKKEGVIASGWHIAPILTESGIRTITSAVLPKK